MLQDIDSDVVLAVQECLSTMAPAYRGLEGDNAVIVEALLLESVLSPRTPVRLAAAQCASVVFPFHHTPSRFVCMLASGDRWADCHVMVM